MKIRAQFERKRLQYDLYDCEIEAVRILKKDVFYTFQHSLLSDYDFLAKYAEAMRIDSKQDLDALRGYCVEEVKRLNGTITLKDAVEWQSS